MRCTWRCSFDNVMVDLVWAAKSDAEILLRTLEPRWSHVSVVGSRAEVIEQVAPAVAAAAWLHDVGYSPALVATGLHALDGALWCREQGYPDEVVSLVAHHTGASFEAAERGLANELARVPAPGGHLLDLLNYLDLTTGRGGQDVSAQDRVKEILGRYEPDSPVHKAVARSGPDLLESARRGEALFSQYERAGRSRARG